MAGYWPSFFCVFKDRDEVEIHKLAKKDRGQYPAILFEQTWSIKDLLYGFRGNFACGIRRVVSQSQRAIYFILPARGASRTIQYIIIWLAPQAGKMNQIARCDWLPERARWSHLARSGLPAVSRKQNFTKSHVI